MMRETLATRAAPFGLITMGVVAKDEATPQTLYLLGTGPTFWPVFTGSPEYRDGKPDPLDRWSMRVLPEIAAHLPATVVDIVYPFGGPPYAPFLRWATETGEAHQSPVGMLVHEDAGLMISYRGGIVVDGVHDTLRGPARAPCETSCPNQPCTTACPVDALSAADGYNVDACHAYLDTAAGQDCLQNGCKARRACPISQRFGRDTAQSAFHMKSFHP
ncbi:MAG: ferredoxin [Pseudomonadota bacterium]